MEKSVPPIPLWFHFPTLGFEDRHPLTEREIGYSTDYDIFYVHIQLSQKNAGYVIKMWTIALLIH